MTWKKEFMKCKPRFRIWEVHCRTLLNLILERTTSRSTTLFFRHMYFQKTRMNSGLNLKMVIKNKDKLGTCQTCAIYSYEVHSSPVASTLIGERRVRGLNVECWMFGQKFTDQVPDWNSTVPVGSFDPAYLNEWLYTDRNTKCGTGRNWPIPDHCCQLSK